MYILAFDPNEIIYSNPRILIILYYLFVLRILQFWSHKQLRNEKTSDYPGFPEGTQVIGAFSFPFSWVKTDWNL